jgi:hypothetical protein
MMGNAEKSLPSVKTARLPSREGRGLEPSLMIVLDSFWASKVDPLARDKL